MRIVRTVMLILALMAVAGKAVAMLPPDLFKGPLFSEKGDKSDDDSGDQGEYTVFA